MSFKTRVSSDELARERQWRRDFELGNLINVAQNNPADDESRGRDRPSVSDSNLGVYSDGNDVTCSREGNREADASHVHSVRKRNRPRHPAVQHPSAQHPSAQHPGFLASRAGQTDDQGVRYSVEVHDGVAVDRAV